MKHRKAESGKQNQREESIYTLLLYLSDLKYISKCVALIARLAIFLPFCVELLIFLLEYIKTRGTLISSPDLIEKIKIFVEKMKNEK